MAQYAATSSRRLILALLLTLSAGLGISALVIQHFGSNSDQSHHHCPTAPLMPDLEVRSAIHGAAMRGNREAVITVMNHSGNPYAYARIHIELCNRDGDTVDIRRVTVYDLKPHGSQGLRVPISRSSVSSVKARLRGAQMDSRDQRDPESY